MPILFGIIIPGASIHAFRSVSGKLEQGTLGFLFNPNAFIESAEVGIGEHFCVQISMNAIIYDDDDDGSDYYVCVRAVQSCRKMNHDEK